MENALLEMISIASKDTLKLLLRLEKSTAWVTLTGAVTRVMKKNVSVQGQENTSTRLNNVNQ